jgi:hypothetical protein
MAVLGLISTVVMIMTAVSSAFGLKTGLDLCEIRSETTEHMLDHMVRPNAKNVASHFSRQMTISEMPCNAYEPPRIAVLDFHQGFRGGSNLKPPAVIELKAIAMLHGDGLGEIEKHFLALVCPQQNAAAVPRMEIERERARCLLLGPLSSPAMYRCLLRGHVNT